MSEQQQEQTETSAWQDLEEYMNTEEPLQWVINFMCDSIMEDAQNA